MHAVEFESSIKKGLIQVPHNFKDLQEVESVRLVVMYDLDDNQQETHDSIKNKTIDEIFDKFQIDMSNYHFDRDEANER